MKDTSGSSKEPGDAGKSEKKQSVIRSAMAMSLGTFSSRILGYVRDMLLLSLYGRTATDAFVVAFKLPNMFRRLLGEGSLSVSFIPVFVDQLTGRKDASSDGSKAQAMSLADAVFSLLLIVTSSLSVLGIIFMEWVLALIVGEGSFQNIPGKFEQTVFLARIMFAYLFLVTNYAFFMAIAQALKKFLIPALGPALFNLVFIGAALLPKEWGRVEGELLAWGVMVGGFVQAALVAGLLLRMQYFPKPTRRIKVPGVKRVLVNMGPGLLGLGVYQVMSVVNLRFASSLPEGAVSYIYTADRILELPQSLIAISLGAALLPTLSGLFHQGKKDEMLLTASRHLRVLLFLALPSAVGMLTLGLPITQVLFMRGTFGMEDAANTAIVIQVYSVLLIASSVGKVVVPSFYAIKNTWLPAVVAGGVLLVHVVVGYVLVTTFGLVGLAVATALSGCLNMSLLFFFYRRMIGVIHGWDVLKSLVRMLPGLLLLGLFTHYAYGWLLEPLAAWMPNQLARAVALFSVIGFSALLYIWVGWMLGSQEAKDVAGIFQRRLKRSKG